MSHHTASVMKVGAVRRNFRSSPTAGAARGALVLGLGAGLMGLSSLAATPAADALSGGLRHESSAARAVPSVTDPSATDPSATDRYILRLAPGTPHERVTSAVEALGGSVVAFQQAVGTVVVRASRDTANRLGGIIGVTSVAPDREVQSQSLGFDPSSQPGSMTRVTDITGAKEFWKAGYTGRGVDVAIIDTGVAPVPGLDDSAKVIVGPDLSFESQSEDTRYLDSYGHGTNMAGIIAGREVPQGSGWNYAWDTSNFYGMAPDARLVSLKLADHGGAVDVSQMIAAIDWVICNANKDMRIRVLNISYGSLSQQDAQSDPLSWAAEVAWNNGIAVVASSGNDGDSVVGLASPAYNPWVIAVGAQDTKGTATYSDDSVPSFSERGAYGGRGPDLVAPGVGIVSLGIPGSNLYDSFSSARIGNDYLRGSGTSQAAAVVSGAVALYLSKYPGAGVDEIKGTFMAKANKLNGVSPRAQGAGALDLRALLNTAPSRAGYTLPVQGNGNGPIDKSRGNQRVTVDGVAISGEQDIFGNGWSSWNLARAATNHSAWTWDGLFNGSAWAGSAFVTDNSSWAGKTWQGKTWQGKTWQGKTWQGKTWQTGQWTGNGWSAASWESPVPTPWWASRTWSSAEWN